MAFKCEEFSVGTKNFVFVLPPEVVCIIWNSVFWHFGVSSIFDRVWGPLPEAIARRNLVSLI